MSRARSARSLLSAVLAAALAACLSACELGRTTPTAPPSTDVPSTIVPPGSARPGASPGATLDVAQIGITLEPFANVAGGPLAMAPASDGTGRLFVAAQDGRVWVVEENGDVLPDPALDLGSRIRSGGEQGLLGIALHPQFPADPRVFVDYTDTNGDTIVASLTIDRADPNRIDAGSHRQLLFVDQPFANHNGGALAFGPDGYLYISLGDGGSGGDPENNGQRLDTLLGKILRIDADGGNGPYAIPSDNPFASGGGEAEIWHYGLRNPWRMSFDRETGDLWIGDVGQGKWEEIDRAAAGAGGLDFGWRIMEGSHCYEADRCDRDGLTLPVSDYGRDLGCTVIGGYVYRGARHASLRGAYLFADYCSDQLFAVDAAAGDLTPPTVVGSGSGRISAWGEDAEGELYTLALDGTISAVVASER